MGKYTDWAIQKKAELNAQATRLAELEASSGGDATEANEIIDILTGEAE